MFTVRAESEARGRARPLIHRAAAGKGPGRVTVVDPEMSPGGGRAPGPGTEPAAEAAVVAPVPVAVPASVPASVPVCLPSPREPVASAPPERLSLSRFAPARWAGWLRRILPTPTGTPFTFVYGLVLLGTALFAELGDEATVNQLLRDSSTDAAHLADQPLVVLVASALWVAGGLYSLYGLFFAVVLSSLERRTGPARTAGVFLLGHVLATLATELPVAGAVAAGRLPEASLHRLDYGISFGVMASVGALSVLLRRPVGWALLAFAALLCAQDLIEFADPLASWGHPIALLTGMACGPFIRDRVPGRG